MTGQDEAHALIAEADSEIELAKRMLSAATVAKELGVHADTVREWCRVGLIEFVRTPSGGYRIPRAVFDDLLLRKIKTRESRESRA